MILDRRCLPLYGLLFGCLIQGTLLSGSLNGEEIPAGSGIVTADFVVEESQSEKRPGEVLQAESEKLFGRDSENEAILRVGGSKSEDSSATKGTSSSKVCAQAINNLPLKQLTEEQKQRVMKVINETGFYRRLPTVVFPAEAECYNYFLDYPESAVSIWRAMGISQIQLGQTSPNLYTGDAGDGTVGYLEVIYRDSDTILVYCDGEYKSPFLKQPIKSQSVLVLETNYFRETDDKVYVTHRADLFVTFPSQTVETVAKVLAPLTAPIADRSFIEISMFLKMMSLAMERRPDWIGQMVDRMDGVPHDRKEKLLAVAGEIKTRSESRISLSDHRSPASASSSRPSAAQIPAVRSAVRTAQPERSSQPFLFRK